MSPGLLLALAVSTTFFVLLAAVALFGPVSLLVVALYLVMSLTSFALYGSDKAAAESGTRRTSELTLHAADLFGGWPGGLVAQQAFRHKTRKVSFRLVFWCTVLANCATLATIAVLLSGSSSLVSRVRVRLRIRRWPHVRVPRVRARVVA